MTVKSFGVNREQLSDGVASFLRQSIMAGEFTAGESIRAEAIGRLLEVSATPVREALQALRAEGFLEMIPHKGFTVAPLVAQDIRDIFAAHALIAGELAARAAVKAEATDVLKLKQIHSALLVAAEENAVDTLESLNHQFHRYVYLLAESNRLRWALSIFTKYVPRQFYSRIDGWPTATYKDHTMILNGIAQHDAETARSAMMTHINNSGDLLALNYKRRSSGNAES